MKKNEPRKDRGSSKMHHSELNPHLKLMKLNECDKISSPSSTIHRITNRAIYELKQLVVPHTVLPNLFISFIVVPCKQIRW